MFSLTEADETFRESDKSQAAFTKEKTIDEASKKSIHARLQEKKNELAKKPGKDNPQRGVELA